MDEHWYYLHTNGDLIHKRSEPDADSPFVRWVYRVDVTSRLNAWRLLVAAALDDARPERIKELADLWKCDLSDVTHYLVAEFEAKGITPGRRTGFEKLSKLLWGIDAETIYRAIETLAPGTPPPDLSRLDATTIEVRYD